MKFDKYTVVGLLCALPYLIFGVILTNSDAVSIVSFLVLTVALTGAEVTLYDMVLSARRTLCLWKVPFSALFFLVQFLLQWNVMIPFYVMGHFAVGVSATKERYEHMPKQKAAKPLLISGTASILFVTVSLITGVSA